MAAPTDSIFDSGVNGGAAADLWRNTLVAIASVFGRLAHLSALRNRDSGQYEHHGLALRFGAEQAHRALRSSHSREFQQWMDFSLEEQKADLNLYMSSAAEDRASILRSWSEIAAWRALIPASVRGAQRKHFLLNVETLMALLRNESGVSCPDPDA